MVRRLTLVELAMVVAIVGLLAAVAIPVWVRLQAEARSAEIMLVGPGILDAVAAYQLAHGPYNPAAVGDTAPHPFPSDFGKRLHPWTEQTGMYTHALSFKPDGDVRARYTWQDTISDGVCANADLTSPVAQVWILSDMDGDGVDRVTRCCGTEPGLDYTYSGGSMFAKGPCYWEPDVY